MQMASLRPPALKSIVSVYSTDDRYRRLHAVPLSLTKEMTNPCLIHPHAISLVAQTAPLPHAVPFSLYWRHSVGALTPCVSACELPCIGFANMSASSLQRHLTGYAKQVCHRRALPGRRNAGLSGRH